jgi:acetylornithine deacetylase
MAISTTLLTLLLLSLGNAAPQDPVVSSTVSSAVASPSASGQATTLTTEETDELFSLHKELVNISSISEDEVEMCRIPLRVSDQIGILR